MSSREQIVQAFHEFQRGDLAPKEAKMVVYEWQKKDEERVVAVGSTQSEFVIGGTCVDRYLSYNQPM